MALELIRDSLEGLHDSLHSEYQKRDDGKFHLIVNGMEDVSGLKANNAKLLEEKKSLQAKYKQFEDLGDPEKVRESLERMRELEETERKLKEKELLAKGDVEEVVNQRTALMRQDHENQVKKLSSASESLTAENEKLRVQLSKAVIERGILDAVNAVGQPRKEAIVDIISRGAGTFKLDENGIPVPLNPDGTTIYGKDGTKAMTMEEWAQSLLETAPHLWLESKGGGARGNVAGADGRTYTAEELDKMSPAQKMNLGRNAARR